MRADAAIERVQGFHAQLRDLMRECVEALDRPEPDTLTLAAIRWRFVRALREYQLFKHMEIFDPIIRSAGSPRSAKAAELKRRCEELGEAYNDHVRRWNLGGTGPASPGFGADARRMMRQVSEQLNREDFGIRRLLAGVERTRQA